MYLDFEKFQQTKAYDLLMGLPLIAWFGYVVVVRVRPTLGSAARALMAQPGNLFLNLHFFSLLAAAAFNLLTIYMIVMRDSPVRRSPGLLPNLCGFVGTFLGVFIIDLKPVTLSLGWQTVSAALLAAGELGSFLVLSRLGKSFAILPEARALVTAGPYAYARHPLYAMEIITVIGTAILYQQPWAGLLTVGVILLLLVRSYFEEKVLTEAYPEYAQYRTRVKRFGFV